MRYKMLILGSVVTMAMELCHAQKKVPYEFPEAMSESVKVEYTKLADKGQVLYHINCSKCHDVEVKRKQVIPDFTREQLTAYELRVSNPKHESEIPETVLTAEELVLIITFLEYKKKNNPLVPFIHDESNHKK